MRWAGCPTHRSTDGGATFVRVSSVGGRAVAKDPNGSGFAAIAGFNLLSSSTDGGSTFDESTDRRDTGVGLASLGALEYGPDGELWLRCRRGPFLLESTTVQADGSLRWRPAFDGLDAWNVRDIALDPRSPARIYIATYSGVLVSNDGGATFAESLEGYIRDAHTLVVVPDPSVPDRLWAGGASLHRSDDAGRSYTRLWNTRSVDSYDIRALVIDGGSMYIGTSGRFLVSTDQGASVTETPGLSGEVAALLSTGPGELLLGTSLGLYRSTDGGASVTPVAGLTASVGALSRFEGGGWLAATDDGLFGADAPDGPWTRVAFDGSGVRAVRALGASEAVVGVDEAAVHDTSDGGAGWTEIDGMNGLGPRTLAFEPASRHLYVGTVGWGAFVTTLP